MWKILHPSSFDGLTCDNTAKTCTTLATNTVAWTNSPTSCVPFLTADGSNRGIINQGLTNSLYFKTGYVANGVAFQSGSIWLAASNASGIIRSKDSGVTWKNVPIGSTSRFNGTSCTGATCVAVGNSGGLLFSTTYGAGWATSINSGGVTSNNLLGVSCSGSTCVAVGASGTIIYSSDSGHTWMSASSGLPTSLNSVSCSSSRDCVAVGASGKIVYTSNSGASWTLATGMESIQYNGVACVGASCVAVGNSTTNISYSNNSGQTWSNSPTNQTTGNLVDIGCTSSYCVVTASTSNRIIRSTNWNSGGAPTWTLPTTSLSVTLGGVRCTGSQCVIGTNTGGSMAYSSNSGLDWTLSTNNLQGKGLFASYCIPGTTTCVVAGNTAGSTGTIARSTDRGATWSLISSVTNAMEGITCNGPTCIAVGAQSSGASKIFRSTNSGESWSSVTSNNSSDLHKVACDGTICLAAGNTVSSVGVINRSANIGASWSPVVTTNAGNNNLLGIGCSSGTCISVGSQGTVVYSTDSDHTVWTAATSGSSNQLNSVACINSTTCIICGSSGTIKITTDSGRSWNSPTTNPTGGNRLESVSCNGSKCLIAGATGTIFISTDSGSNWKPLLPSMYNVTLGAVSVF